MNHCCGRRSCCDYCPCCGRYLAPWRPAPIYPYPYPYWYLPLPVTVPPPFPPPYFGVSSAIQMGREALGAT